MIAELTSGECRSIGRPDLHVYCHNPMRAITTPEGRQAWRREAGDARYCIVCPEEGLDYLPYGQWMTLDEVERIVSRLLYGDPRPKKRGAA